MGGADLFAPDIARLAQVHDKYRFIQLCEDIGLTVPPRTHLLVTDADRTAHESAARALVFKPVWSRFGGAEVLIRPPDIASLRRVKPTALAPPWIAQEHLSGTEICAYAVARQGRVVALAAYRGGLVRAGPGGAAVCFDPMDAEIIRPPFVETFVRATKWTGQVSFDLIRTEDGQILPLECNPRSTSGLHFFTDGGAAFARALTADGGEVRPDVTHPQAVRMALWLYGVPMVARRRERRVFLDALNRSTDVMDWPGDRIGWVPPQLRSVAEFAAIALRQRISLPRASTWGGIEWGGGADQSSIS